MEHLAEDNSARRTSLLKGLDGFLNRDRDRELFDLPPKQRRTMLTALDASGGSLLPSLRGSKPCELASVAIFRGSVGAPFGSLLAVPLGGASSRSLLLADPASDPIPTPCLILKGGDSDSSSIHNPFMFPTGLVALTTL